ncbi:MAG: SWIM zinc finger family protein [Acidobacteria bacterium]|nr:SWIM zinc finger family protein [Acidobacteriota bacterium]
MLSSLHRQLAAFDDAAFEALANKGLVRRARKDLQSGVLPEVVADTEQELVLRVAEATVTLTEQGPPKARCSCPAVDVCRHILMACLWVKELSVPANEVAPVQPLTTTTNEVVKDDLATATDQLLSVSLEALIRWAGKTTLKQARSALLSNPRLEISTGGAMVFQIPDFNVTCRYFSQSGLMGMLCSCKAREVCFHRVLAVLLFQQRHGKTPDGAGSESQALKESNETPRSRADILNAAQKLLEEIVAIGLCHLTETTQQRLATLAISATGVNLPRLALGLRTLSSEVGLQLQRNARADLHRFFLILARTHALCRALTHTDNHHSRSDLIGQHRTVYHEAGTLDLIGVGAYAWETPSGYAGLTVLFWENSTRQWHTWSEARPVFQGVGFDPQARYLQEGPWSGMLNPAQVSQHRFALFRSRRNPQFRLSGSSQSRAFLKKMTSPRELQFGSMLFSNWNQLRAYATTIWPMGLAEPNPNAGFVVVQPASWGQRWFDETEQALFWELFDDTGDEIPLMVPYRKLDQPRINQLEALSPAMDAIWGVVARLELHRSQLVLAPVSLLRMPDGDAPTVINLGLTETTSQPISNLPKKQPGSVIESEVETEVEPGIEIADDVQSPISGWLQSLTDTLQSMAESGGATLLVSHQTALTSLAKHFENIGMTAVTTTIRPLLDTSSTRPGAMLHARYVCQLCLEAERRLRLAPSFLSPCPLNEIR